MPAMNKGKRMKASIAGVEAIEESANVYTLNGQKVQNPKKGLYIRDGKKVVVK